MIRPGLHLIVGPMFARKSTELITRVQRLELAGRSVLTYKPRLDTRSPTISSHDGLSIPSLEITDSTVDILPFLIESAQPDALAFDEVQFLQPHFADMIASLAGTYQIICAGLDLDAFGQPFETTMRLLALAETVEKRKAVCSCGEDASRTQRIADGVAVTSGQTIQVGGLDSYTARCIVCFESVPQLQGAAHE